jgi:hypothetical protein
MSASFLRELPHRPEAILRAVAYGYSKGDWPQRSACSSMAAPSAVHAARTLCPDLQVIFNETPEPWTRLILPACDPFLTFIVNGHD